MLLIRLYFTSALLLLALSSPVRQVRQSPLEMDEGQMADSCVLNARTLLRNITDALTQDDLFSGIKCEEENMELNLETNTPSVCTPKDSICSGSIKLDFDEESCLTNIRKDLTHYYSFLSAQPDPENVLGSSVLHSLGELMQNCFEPSQLTDLVLNKAAVDRPSNYAERLRLCKVLRGFQVRAITINRAIAYINSGRRANPQ